MKNYKDKYFIYRVFDVFGNVNEYQFVSDGTNKSK